MLETRNINVVYGESAALSDISVAVRPGELMAIVGPNGAGKTTLLRVLNGSALRASGETLLDGKPLTSFSRGEIAKKIAVVAQENETKFPMTVMEFVLAGLFAQGSAFGWERPEDLKIASDSLALCGLESFSHRLMNELSGGERQRVLLARAFTTKASILLLDEPTNNLDLANQALILRLVKERCQHCESSAVVVTHDLNLASEFADRVLLVNAGRIAADGTPEEVLTEENVSKVFGMNVLVDRNPHSGKVRVTAVFG